jgi:hypothetical protein
VYQDEVDDPWFTATRPGANGTFITNNGTSVDRPLYLGDYPTNSLACAEQHQICRVVVSRRGYKRCTPLSGSVALADHVRDLTLNPNQQAIADRFMYNIGGVGRILELNNQALLAADYVQYGRVAALPQNQWKAEVAFWHNTTLAILQRQFVEFAMGPSDARVRPWQQKPDSNSSVILQCASQKVLGANYRNFNAIGVIVVIVLGLVVITINSNIMLITDYVQDRRGRTRYRRLAWTTDGLYQLHRMTQEDAGYGRGNWELCDELIPVTTEARPMGALDLTDVEHPVIERLASAQTGDGMSERKGPRIVVDTQDRSAPQSHTPRDSEPASRLPSQSISRSVSRSTRSRGSDDLGRMYLPYADDLDRIHYVGNTSGPGDEIQPMDSNLHGPGHGQNHQNRQDIRHEADRSLDSVDQFLTRRNIA